MLRRCKPLCFFLLLVWTLVGQISLTERRHYHKDGDLRIVDGFDKTSGTVQVFRGYSWASICDDRWTMREGNVACRQMGMGYAIKVYRSNYFKSKNSVDYLLDDLHCIGNETLLVDCKHRGWGIHNCKRNEQVGVQCLNELMPRSTLKWNPLNLIDIEEEEVKSLEKNPFKLVKAVEPLEGYNGTVLPVLVKLSDGSMGSVCPDYFGNSEAMVFCKELGLGVTGKTYPIPMYPKIFPAQRHLLLVGRCYGNETSLNSCTHYTASLKKYQNQLPCQTDYAIGVECFRHGSDLVPSKADMERSAYIQRVRLWHLECAIEEGCLPESVNTLMERDPNGYMWKWRLLLRFTSIIENVGTSPFIPINKMSQWEWHSCHMHYHSMKTFALYNLIDPANRVIATGHKASFCLEDSECNRDVEKKFRCSNVIYNYGTQGISPGCRDTYLHDYDCQWIDVTDVAPGKYNLEIVYNPDMLVSESDYFNNGLACDVSISEVAAYVRNCKPLHPLDMT